MIEQASKGGRVGCWLHTDIPSVIKMQLSKASYILQRPFFLPCYKSVTCIRTGPHTDRLTLELGRQWTSLKRQCVKQPIEALAVLAVIVVMWPSRSHGKVKEDPTNTDCCDWDNEAILRSSIAERLRGVIVLLAYANASTFGTCVFLKTLILRTFFITLIFVSPSLFG